MWAAGGAQGKSFIYQQLGIRIKDLQLLCDHWFIPPVLLLLSVDIVNVLSHLADIRVLGHQVSLQTPVLLVREDLGTVLARRFPLGNLDLLSILVFYLHCL